MAARPGAVTLTLEAFRASLPGADELPPEALQALRNAFDPAAFAFGDTVVREGDEADAAFIVGAGRARVWRRGRRGEPVHVLSLAQGDIFGEAALLAGGRRTASVRASDALLVFRLSRARFDALVAAHPDVRRIFEREASRRAILGVLRGGPLAALPPPVLADLVRTLVPRDIAAGEVVVREGDPPGPLFAVEKGRFKARRGGGAAEEALAFLREGDVFGELSALRALPRAATVEAVTAGRLLALSSDDLNGLLDRHPSLLRAIEELGRRYEGRRGAHLPLDFHPDLLPLLETAAVAPSPSPSLPARAPAPAPAPQPALAPAPDALDDLLRPGAAAAPPRRIRRFPLVFQIDEMDCGVACLAMVCRFFGRRVGLAHLRERARTSTGGTTMRAIAAAAEGLGLAARTLKASARNLDRLPLPAMVHVGGDHWACLVGIGPGRVRLADPAAGERRLPREEFERLWTGFTILFDPTPAFEKAPEEAPPLERLVALVRPLRGELGRAAGVAAAGGALSVAVPLCAGALVDVAAAGGAGWKIALLLLVVAAAAAFRFGSAVLARHRMAAAVARLDESALDLVTKTLLGLPLRFFLERRAGDLERRLDAARFAGAIALSHGAKAAQGAAALLATLAALVILSPPVALAWLLAAVPLYAGLALWFGPRVRPLFRNVEEMQVVSRALETEAVRRIEALKLAVAEDAFRARLLRRHAALDGELRRAELFVEGYRAAAAGLALLATAAVLGTAAVLAARGALSPGALVAAGALAALAAGPIADIFALLDRLAHAEAAARRLVDVLESPPEPRGDLPVPSLSGALEVRGLTVRYGGPESPPALERVSFAVPAGAVVAVFGKSGAGKTSLLRCLAGLVEPAEGAILFDGVDARRLKPRELRRKLGTCLEQPEIVTGTAIENIALGGDEGMAPGTGTGTAGTAAGTQAGPAFERAADAARAADAHDFLVRLPRGYETPLGEGGAPLSGGERARLGLARALYRRPPILLLDEALAALDAAAERRILDRVEAALPASTIVVVSNRPATLKDADVVLVLDEGRLVEHGTHDELIARRGVYFYAQGT